MNGFAKRALYSSISSLRRAAGIVRLGELAAEDDVDRALGPHHGHLGRRPGEVEVGADVLAAHHVVGAAVGLARDHGELRRARLAVRVEQLRAVADDPVPLLRGAGQEARDVDERDDREPERVARAHEARRLDRRVDVEHAGERLRLVADDADGMAAEAGEAADDVLRVALVDLHEVAVVDDMADDRLDVVGLRRRVRDDRVELGRAAVAGVVGAHDRHGLEVVLRQEREQVAGLVAERVLVVGDEVGDARALRVRVGAAEVLERDLLAGDRAHDLGPGDEHVRGAARHQHEIGDRRRVDRPARARAHDERDLRDHAGGHDVAPEDLGVASERDHALLDARPARVVDPDHGAAEAQGEIHDLADLLRVGLAERAAEDREVLREHEDLAAVHRAVAGDDAVAVGTPLGEPEVRAAVLHERVELDEGGRIEQSRQPLAREALPPLALALHRALVTGVLGALTQQLGVRELLRRGVRNGFVGGHRAAIVPESRPVRVKLQPSRGELSRWPIACSTSCSSSMPSAASPATRRTSRS